MSDPAAARSAPEDADHDILESINALYHEEEELYARAGSGDGLDGPEIERLKVIQVRLDQAYDLLHQRQGRRDAGQDPSSAEVRPVDIVEHYRQ
jgi:hypothetical protein